MVTPFVLVTPRSVTGAAIDVVAVAVLLPASGSEVRLETVTVFAMGSGVV